MTFSYRQSLAGASEELLPYLTSGFGHESRIDYGTGHESTFVIFLYCLFKLGVITAADLTVRARAGAASRGCLAADSLSSPPSLGGELLLVKGRIESDVIPVRPLQALVLRGFTAYLRVMRRLQVRCTLSGPSEPFFYAHLLRLPPLRQTEYMLEPAGSHGVWGLDDYHCLVFFWGSSQLIGHPSITPESVQRSGTLLEEAAPDS